MTEQARTLSRTGAASGQLSWRDYLELTKPRVVALMILGDRHAAGGTGGAVAGSSAVR